MVFIASCKNDFFLFYIIIMNSPNFDNHSKTSAIKKLRYLSDVLRVGMGENRAYALYSETPKTRTLFWIKQR